MIVKMEKEHLDYITKNVEPIDRLALIALNGVGFDVDEFVERMMSSSPLAYCCIKDDVPVVASGVKFMGDGVGQAWMLGTCDWPKVVCEVTRETKKVMGLLLQDALERIEVYSIKEHEVAHNWYRLLGLKFEQPLPWHGKQGEDFLLFSRGRR